MGKIQKVYTREFKEEAVRLAQTTGKPITQIARELGILDTSIRQWHKELSQHGNEAFPGSGHQIPLEEENLRLKRELERNQEECVGSTIYPSHEHARCSLFEYLEIYYNRQRRHSSLGYISPLIYEQTEKQRAGEHVDALRVS